jgi:hypothetical protein
MVYLLVLCINTVLQNTLLVVQLRAHQSLLSSSHFGGGRTNADYDTLGDSNTRHLRFHVTL